MMCDYEEFLFDCGHSHQRLKSYCHFARNDPNHQCFGVKKLRDVWEQQTVCDDCAMQLYQAQKQWAQQDRHRRGGGELSPSPSWSCQCGDVELTANPLKDGDSSNAGSAKSSRRRR